MKQGRKADTLREAKAMNKLVKGVAAIIAQSLAFDPDYTLETAKRINSDGWTVEISAPMNSVVRHENVYLTDEELQAAYAQAEEWEAAPFRA
jgi:hypothetical protein